MKKAKTVSILFSGAAVAAATGINATPAAAGLTPTATPLARAAAITSPVGHLQLSMALVSPNHGSLKGTLTCGAHGSASGTLSQADAVAACEQLLAVSGHISLIPRTNSNCPPVAVPVSDKATESWRGSAYPSYDMRFSNGCVGNSTTGGHLFNSTAYG